MSSDDRSAGSGRATRGRFITLEGIDGAGKSTHIEAIASMLAAGGREVVLTREPGGTPLGERLRELLLDSAMDAVSEALLVFAARRDHVNAVIGPALARGAIVVCDRFSDASFAYQGGGRGCDWQLLCDLERWVLGELQPDLTLWFDLPPGLAATRRSAARDPDRFEREDLAFFDRVRTAYLRRMDEAPMRFVRIDATLGRASVWQQVADAIGRDGT